MDDLDIQLLLEENKHLKEKYLLLEQKERIIRVINNFATSILEQDTVEDILWAIAKNAIAKLGFVDCVVYLVDEEKGILHQKAAHGPKNPIDFEIYNQISIPIGEGVVGTVAKTGIPELIPDTSLDKRYIVDDEYRMSELAVPIVMDNKVIGVIDSEHPEKNFYTSEHLQILTTIALMSSTRIMNALAKEKLTQYQNKLEQLVESRTSELKGVIRQLKNSNRDLEQYAYAASHDLQEPLRTVSTFLQLLQRREDNLSKESLEFIEYAVDGSKRMKKMLEGLLEYSRVGSTRHQETEVNLNILLKDIKKSLTFSIRDTNAKILIPDGLPIITGYTALLRQLFQNLISNSIKFRQKDIPPILQFHYKEEENFHSFQLVDNGIGIEPEHTARIFNLFTRLHPQSVYEGTGLGLSLCKRIIEKHGGDIQVISEGEGKGCVFNFSFSK